VFHKYLEGKKAQAAMTEVQEIAQIQIRTMQRTILPPPKPLGSEDETTDLRSEVAMVRCNNHASLNSSVAHGGMVTVEPIMASGNNSSRNQ
jgi:hypothetical protein